MSLALCRIVKLRSLKRMYPDVLAKLHPRAKDVVIQSGGASAPLSTSVSKRVVQS